ncbi:MAG TPA: hypothetical protein VFS12_05980 [Terriglobia bacterium]|nr:hypothetical protein [Terriglobia bacterium]
MTKRWILCVLLVGVTSTSALGQQSSPPRGESHKYRTILTLAGGGGGFAVGLFAGLAAFDDATNSDRKVWTTAILAGVGGAIGGYFLGRAVDRRSKTSNVTGKSDAFEQSLVRDQWPTPWMDETLKARQRSDLNSLPVSHLAAKGSVNQASDSAPSLDTNYLYLISALRRMQMGAD